MAGNEATINGSLRIRKIENGITTIDYRPSEGAFTATVVGSKGPVPGSISVSTVGVSVDFSELTQPGLCRIKNQDSAITVMVGIWEPDTSKFYPFMDLLPGERYPIRLSHLLSGELGGGIGTDGASNNSLMIKSLSGTPNVLVEAFEA
jgi:hypothetical protein